MKEVVSNKLVSKGNNKCSVLRALEQQGLILIFFCHVLVVHLGRLKGQEKYKIGFKAFINCKC